MKQCYVLKFLIVILLFDKSLCEDGPEIRIEDGNMIFQVDEGKHIKVILDENSYFNIDDLNLLDAINKSSKSSKDHRSHIFDDEELFNIQLKTKRIRRKLYGGSNNIITRLENLENSTLSGRQRISLRRIQRRLITLENRVNGLLPALTKDNCNSAPCQNGGRCIGMLSGFMCICPKGWEGKTCSNDVNECALYQGTELGCHNDGQCINTPGTYSCICKAGWYGSHCMQNKVDCLKSSPSEVCGHGVCVNINNAFGYTCICDQGWKTNGITPACTVDVDECAESHPPCKSTCQNLPGSFRCGPCPAGLTGNGFVCKDIDECATNNGGCSVNPHVNCFNTRGSFFCGECPIGWIGDGKTCTKSKSCGNNTNYCHHRASCEVMGNSIVCICPNGMTGTGIGVHGCVPSISDVCSSQPCLNGGRCTVVNSTSYNCTCRNGYSGSNCERSNVNSVCNPNPCLNNGICVSTGNSKYRCNCQPGYSGPHCNLARTRCGGVLRNSVGVLKYPPVSNYEHNTRCAWIIRTNVTQVLNVTFTKFDLEGSGITVDCRYDWLQIHDGSSPAAYLIGRFCGNTPPKGGNIISTRNELYLWFRSDNSTSGAGFELSWQSIAPICGGEIQTESHGIITSPGSPGNYPKNRMCTWHIVAPFGKRIRLTFFTMQLENHSTCDYDYLAVYEGDVSEGQPILKICNTSYPAPFTAPANEITIVFHSDDQGTDAGFQMNYHVTEGIPGCGGTFTLKRGEFGTPLDRENQYPDDLFCEYKIKIPGNTRIQISFTKFDIEKSDGCIFDYVEVFDKIKNETFLVGRWCGDNTPRDYKSQSNTLLIKFVSDTSGSFGGFHLKYETICGGVFEDDSGMFTSPRYPNPYDNDTNCLYEIDVPINKIVILEFQDFDLEERNSYSDKCTHDYVEITFVEGHSGERYCGRKPPAKIISDHNFIGIYFHTDESNTGRGFKANYSVIDTECGGVLRKPDLTITPPMDKDSSTYKHEIDCTWVIVAPPGQTVQLTFPSFHLEEVSDCIYDYVIIYNNYTSKHNDEQEENKLGKFCGEDKPPTVMSTSNVITIKFHSDSTNSGEGFTANYIFVDYSKVCGGRYFASSGKIQSPGWPSSYPPTKACTWIIIVPSGKQIELRVLSFKLEEKYDCAYDYLEIRNGGTETSPLLGKFCGSKIPKKITSLSNHLYLKFKSDASTEFKGFQIEYDSASTGCGGTLTTYQGSITSPQYPQTYPYNAICNWLISTSYGSTLSLVLTDIDFEDSNECDYDFLEIYDGETVMSKKLGQFCKPLTNPIMVQTHKNTAFLRMETDNSAGGRGFSLSYSTNCNMELIEPYGAIESPNYPEEYPTSIDCQWKIKAPKGNRIHIEFSHLELEEKTQIQNAKCRFDFVKIIDIIDGHEANERRYCYGIPPPINSTQNEMIIKFSSDFSQTGSGFHLEYKVQGCMEVFTREKGQFSSPGYPRIYKSDIECHYRIIAEIGKTIELSIFDLDIEKEQNCKNDGLLIANGNDESNVISKLCGKYLTNMTFTSSNHEMFLKFYSNSVIQGRGFNATYEIKKSKCGGIMQGSHGLIYSPNYPRNYDSNSHCEWLIKTDSFHTLNLTIEEFDTEVTEHCQYDFLKIYDGNEQNEDHLLGQLCGHDVPENNTLYSTTNEMLILFDSDGSMEYKGFKLSYRQNCGQRIMANSTGSIAFTKSILDIKFCIWTIIASELNQHVTFTVTHLEEYTPTFQPNNIDEECLGSGVIFYDGDTTNAPIKRKVCSSHTLPIISFGNALTLKISTDIITKFEGYYSVFENSCGGVLNSFKGIFSSPLYPDSYPINTQCIWTIEATDGNSIELNIEFIDIENSEDCNKDYLEIREMNSSGRILGIFCGDNIPAQLKAEKKLWIKFSSDGDEIKKGFFAQYNYAHDNELSGTSGIVTSPRYPSDIPLMSIYTWRIYVPRGNVVGLNLVDLQEHIIPYIKIFNGYDKSSTEFTLNNENPIMYSGTNVVFITSIRGPFKIEWVSVPRSSVTNQTNNSCPQNRIITVGNTTVILNSPGYPHGYSNNLECSWIIKSEDISKHPVIEVMNVDLENDEYCGTDYIRISNFTDMIMKQGDKICKTTPNTITTYEGTLMRIDFVTDFSVNRTGFSTMIKTKCGSDIKGLSSGEINGSQFNTLNSYIPPFQCVWSITVRPGGKIQFKFSNMSIYKLNERCINYVMLRNGIDNESPILGSGKYCGNDAGEIPLTSSNRAYIKWAKNIVSLDSWTLKFDEVRDECSLQKITLNDDNNGTTTISSPHYPLSPPPFSECEWLIMTPGRKRLRIDFDEKFDLTESENCNREYVEIRDGGTKYSKLLGKLCGTEANSIHSTSSIVRIKYANDISSPKSGFKANISIAECGGTFYQQNGIITSPSYPHNIHLPNNIECEYRIQRPPGTQINLTLVDLNLYCESPYKDEITINSIDDSLGYKIDNTTELNDICDDLNTPYNFTVSSNQVLIKFIPSKQSGVLRRGFKINYASDRESCGGYIEAESGIITSPYYPNRLRGRRRGCVWRIKVPKGQRIKLKIIDFDMGIPSIENSPRAYPSRIIVFNDHQFYSKITDITTNTSLIDAIYSSDNTMALYSIVYGRGGRGFKLEFTSEEVTVCVNPFTDQFGEFQLPNSNNKSYFCEYDVSSRENETITFKINKFIIMNTTDIPYACEFRPILSFQNSLEEKFLTFCSNQTSYVFSSSLPDLQMRLIQTASIQIKFLQMSYKISNCGGVLTVIRDLTITEKDLGNDNTDCVWQINAKSKDDHLSVSMETNFKTDCFQEYLIINRGIYPNGPHLGLKMYCSEGFINSTVRTGLYIEYHSETRNSDSKFHIAISYEELCGGYLTAPFPDIKLRKKYLDNIECIWFLMAPVGYVIELEFYDRFHIQSSENCAKDYLQIESVENDEIFGRYCGRDKPNNIVSRDQFMKIIFRTDESIRGDGFSIHLRTTCGGVYDVKKEKKFLHSPNYPKNYDNNLNCNYTLIAPESEYIHVHILEFDLEHLNRCLYDNVTVCVGMEDWNNGEYESCEVYCEKNSLKELRHKKRISIIFKTDAGTTRKGFRLSYGLDDCGGEIKKPSHINSPLKLTDGKYYNDMNCIWNITAPSDKKIIIKFELFDMEFSTTCEFDYVEIYSGNSETADGRLARLCGNLTGQLPVISINKNNGLVISRTDLTNSHNGFNAYINFVRECDENIEIQTDHSYEFNKFSDHYEDNLDCNYVFKTTPGYHIQASFMSFHVSECKGEYDDKFSCDYVEIHDGQGPFSDLIGRYTGHDLPLNITSTKSSLYLKFVTDSVETSTGFKMILKGIPTTCGPTELNVEENKPIYLESPAGKQNKYLPGVRCQWEVSSEFHSLHFHFEKFDLQDSDDSGICSSDALEIMPIENTDAIQEGLGASSIYRGMNSYVNSYYFNDAFPRHMYCGNGIPNDYYTNTRKALIKFKTDNTIEKSGFKIKMSAVSGCFRNYTSTQGRILFETAADCKFQINAPENYTISLYYDKMYFSGINCNEEFLKVTDKKSNKELQKLCSMTEPSASLFTNTSQLEVEIKTEGYYSRYDITYLASNNGRGCGGDIYNYEGIFTSPMYPLNNRGKSDCRWNIRVPNNKKVLLYFEVFDLGSKITCESDYVEIIDQEKAVRKFCGEDKPGLYISEKEQVSVRFRKTANYDGTGWVIRFSNIDKQGIIPKDLLDKYNSLLQSNIHADYF